jgi:signal transduction histidine kinase/CheY-like chemotaxis protein/tetratricopeptide (TPR) repeat protein
MICKILLKDMLLFTSTILSAGRNSKYVIYIFLMVHLWSSAQQLTDLENLKKEIVTTLEPENKIKLLTEIALQEQHPDSILFYSAEGLRLSTLHNYANYQALHLLHESRAYITLNDVQRSLNRLEKAMLIPTDAPEVKAYGHYIEALYYSMLGDHQKAITILENHLKDATTPYYRGLILRLLMKSHNDVGHTTQALGYGFQAVEIAEKEKFEALLFDLYLVFSETYYAANKIDTSMEYLLKASQDIHEDYQNKALVNKQLGVIYQRGKEYDKAEKHYKDAINALKDEADNWHHLGAIYNSLSTVYRFTKRFELQDEALKKGEQYALKLADPRLLSMLQIQMAKYDDRFDNKDAAVVYAQKVFERSLSSKDTALIIESGTATGRYISSLGQYKEADYYFDQSDLHITNATSLKLRYLFTRAKARHYRKQGDNDNAYRFLKKYMYLGDSLNEIQYLKTTEELKIKYETEIKETEIQKLSENNKIQEEKINLQRKIYILITLLLLLISISVFSYFKNKRQKKLDEIQNELKIQNDLINTKNRIVENLSHEIRTPITIINGYSDLIVHNNVSPQLVTKYASLIHQNGDSLLNSINSFLTLLKSDHIVAKTQSIKKIFLKENIKKNVYAFTSNMHIKSQQLFFKTNIIEQCELEFNFEDLKKILNNLISNAIKYSESNSKVYVSALIKEDQLEVLVKDQGIGIKSSELEQIFTRFYQSDEKNKASGFGIGLALVKHICKKNEWKITVKSEKGLGSEFKLLVPLDLKNPSLYTQVESSDYEELKIEEDLEKNSKKEYPSVLLVDDNLEMLRYLQDLLSSFLDCHMAFDGESALKMVGRHKFHLIISDYKMPKMDGLEFKEELNKITGFDAIPFILLTSQYTADVLGTKLRYGINDYVTKPFNPRQFIASVRHVLSNGIYQSNAVQDHSEVIEFEGHITDLMEKINGLVKKNISDSNYSIGDLASDCGYSQKTLSKLVKEHTGLTLVKIMLEIRLLKAYELIANNKYSTIMEVIYAVGLTSRSYFNKKFVTRFGIKPNRLNGSS